MFIVSYVYIKLYTYKTMNIETYELMSYSKDDGQTEFQIAKAFFTFRTVFLSTSQILAVLRIDMP